MVDLVIRDATQEDILKFFDKYLGFTLQAVVLVENGVPIAIVGGFFNNGCIAAFSEIKPEARKYKLSIYRLAKTAYKLARKKQLPIIAQIDKNEKNAFSFLQRFNFEFLREGFVQWRR